ncbi:hypothetical protein Emag_003054 [Eimeria magna]
MSLLLVYIPRARMKRDGRRRPRGGPPGIGRGNIVRLPLAWHTSPLGGPKPLPSGARAFASRSRRQVESFWEAEHLAHDLQNEAQRVDDAEEQHATLTGREVQSLWESEEIQDEFHRSIGRRRATSGARRAKPEAAATAATSTPAGPSSQVEADWRDWLRRYEPTEEAFSPPPPPSHGGRGRRRRPHKATALENEPHEKQRAEAASLDFVEGVEDPVDALFDYASLRGGDYRDLTHEEAIRMRDAYQQKLLLDRRIRWLKSRALPDPERDAAALIRAQEPQLEEILTWNSAEVLHGLLGGASVSIHHVEQQTTRSVRCYSAVISSHVWDGKSSACSPTIPACVGPCRSVCYVFFTVASGHDPKDVEVRLNHAAPHLRMQMARRLELGFTPPFRFVHQGDHLEINKHSLFKLATESTSRTGNVKKQKQQTIATAWAAAMNRPV